MLDEEDKEFYKEAIDTALESISETIDNYNKAKSLTDEEIELVRECAYELVPDKLTPTQTWVLGMVLTSLIEAMVHVREEQKNEEEGGLN